MDQGNYPDKVISINQKRIAPVEPRSPQKFWSVRSKFSFLGLRDSDATMERRPRNSNVIGLTDRRKTGHRAGADDRVDRATSNMRVIAITSGKGGVGKTNVVANLGYALSQMGERILILDADFGLGNLDILLGVTPRYNLSHVIAGEKSISEIVVEGPGNIQILPAASGIEEVTQLSSDQRNRLLYELQLFTDTIDVLFIDTAAGISSNVLAFNKAAQEILVVVSPEPTSITDAYALMKVMSMKYETRNFKLLVNSASDSNEAYEVYRQLQLVTNRFLDITIDYLGCILVDKNVPRCVRRQKIVSDVLPATVASQCFYAIARKLKKQSSAPDWGDGTDGFWENLFDGDDDDSA